MTPAAYQAAVTLIGRRVSALLLQRWRLIDRGNIAASWQHLLPLAVEVVATGQRAGADLADPYLDAVVGPGDGAALVVPQALAGRTLDGRTLEGLLVLPAYEALHDIGQGRRPAAALRAASETLGVYARTAVADSARQAVAAGMGARKVGGYYRRLTLPSCARCVILAGRWYRSNQGFLRHPKCDCVHVPGNDPGGGPGFDARQAILDGQVTGLSRSATEAIRLGADPAAVVNARRGMSTVGGRQLTTEGTTVRGFYGGYVRLPDGTVRRRRRDELARTGGQHYRTAIAPRPTPEQILRDATSRDDAIRLLNQYGYIL